MANPERIDLMRHAQDESARATPAYHPRPDSPLTEHGIEQARAAAVTLDTDYAGIVYSPLLRAMQTAHVISQVSGIPLLTKMPALREWRPPGCVYGKSPEEYDEDYRTWRYARTQDPALAYQDGESLLNLHTRAATVVLGLRLLAQSTGPLLAISHKVLLGVIVARHDGPVHAFQQATSRPWPHCATHPLADHASAEP